MIRVNSVSLNDSQAMKKFIFPFVSAVAAVAAVVSCQREEPGTTVPSAHVYRFELVDGETKACLEEEGVFWEAGDQVGLFPGNGAAVTGSVNASASPKTVSFSSLEAIGAGTPVYAYYSSFGSGQDPNLTDNTTAEAARIVIPSTQEGGSRSAMPLVGVPFAFAEGTSNGKILFRNLGSILDFRVYSTKHAGEQVCSITLTATAGGHPLSGEAKVNLTAVSGEGDYLALDWTGSENGPSSVTLTQIGAVAVSKEISAAGHQYMVVAPGTYSFTTEIVTNIATYTFPATEATFNRNGIKRFNLNLDNALATRTGARYVRVNSVDEIVNGKYLIVYEDNNTAKIFHPAWSGSSFQGNVESIDIQTDGSLQTIASTPSVDACQVLLTKASGSGNPFYIRVTEAGRTLYLSRSTLSSGENTSSFEFNTSGDLKMKIKRSSSNNYFLSYNGSSFRVVTSSGSASLVALYKPDEGNVGTQPLRFSAATFTCSLGDQVSPAPLAGAPSLLGAETPVTYSSSDASVATVDSSSGEVTLMGTGQTVIKATAKGTERYLEATAAYLLTVFDVPTYSLENDRLTAYLDEVMTNPYDPRDYTYTYMTSSLYSGNTSTTNRLDWPKPVPISWENPADNAEKVVRVYYDGTEELAVPAVSVAASATSVDIYNLIPGKTYSYEVTCNGQPVKDGRFGTTGRRRMMKVGDSPYGQTFANNCRDFGGQMTESGRMIKYGILYRGSNLDGVANNGQKGYLTGYMNIGLDVDLRSNSERNDALGFDSDGDPYTNHTTQPYNSWPELSNVTSMRSTLLQIFDTVLGGENGEHKKSVYIHCKVGADRTGYVCMLLEALLGLSQSACDVDYELTSFSGAVSNGGPRTRTGSNNYYYLSKEGTIRGVDFINTFSGQTYQAMAVNYVVNTLGIPMSTITAFQQEMLE